MTRSPPFGQKTTLGCACFQKYAQNSPTSLKLVVDGFLLRYQTAIIAKYFRTKYKLLTTLRRSYADILAQTMSAAPLPPQPDSATSRHGRALAYAPVGRPGLCGHHQRPRDRSSTKWPAAMLGARHSARVMHCRSCGTLGRPCSDIATSPQRRCSRCVRNMQTMRTGELENNVKAM